MSKVEKVSIALPPAMTKFVHKAVAAGKYASASEVVREALRDWQEKQETPRLTLNELKQMWEQGVASGPGKLGSFEAIRAEAKRLSAKATASET